MKKICLFIGLISYCYAFGQMHDNNLIQGQKGKNISMNFQSNFPTFEYKNFNNGFKIGSYTFSDSLGNLLFYSNGVKIFNRNNQLMENGDSLIVDNYSNNLSTNLYGYGSVQSSMALIDPENPNIVLFFTTSDKFVQFPSPYTILLSKIDISANNGLGKVLSKREIIYEGLHENFRVIKHANGRDWWMIVAKLSEPIQEYFTYLISPDGINEKSHQVFNVVLSTDPNWVLTTAWTEDNNLFTPNGKKYVDVNGYRNSFLTFDFDRCDGSLSAMKQFAFPNIGIGDINYISCSSIGISPNSRFLYYYRNQCLLQFDLEDEDIVAKVDTIKKNNIPEGIYSGNGSLNTTPNGRMHAGSYYFINGFYYGSSMNMINFPNKKSTACNFRENVLYTKSSVGELISSQPYFPNYRLGPLDDSPCDTLGFDNHPLSQWHWDVEDIDNEPFKVTFTDNSFYEPSSWHWDFNGLGVSQDTSPVFTFPGVGTYPVCLIVCNQYSCDTLCRDVTLGYAPPPVYASASFELPSDTACLNQFITFQTTESDAYEHRWNFGINALPQQYAYGAGPHQVKFSTLGNQIVLLEAANLISYDTLSQIIQIVPLAVANYTQVKNGNTVVFTNTSVLGVSYLWDFGDGYTSTEVSPTHVFQNDGLYIVKLTVFGQCNTVFKSKELSITTVGVEELNKHSILIDVYPNPVNDMLYLSTSDFDLNNLSYEVSNVMGQSLQKGRFIGSNPQINTSDFAPNHYFLKILDDRFGLIVLKFVKQ
jgi:hypothetical protein